jgi:hypothetical protein
MTPTPEVGDTYTAVGYDAETKRGPVRARSWITSCVFELLGAGYVMVRGTVTVLKMVPVESLPVIVSE